MMRRRVEKITTSMTTALTQYYLEHEVTNLKIELTRLEHSIRLHFSGDVVMSNEEFATLCDFLNQPTVAENEYYYMELIDSSAKQDLRILGSLVDAKALSFDGSRLVLDLEKAYQNFGF